VVSLAASTISQQSVTKTHHLYVYNGAETVQYGDIVGNITENSSIFSLIQMC